MSLIPHLVSRVEIWNFSCFVLPIFAGLERPRGELKSWPEILHQKTLDFFRAEMHIVSCYMRAGENRFAIHPAIVQ